MTSIIILVQNRYDVFKRCIDTILQYTTSPYELVLVLQAITDQRILDLVESLTCPKVVLINDYNTGVTPGRNQGILASTGEYLLFFDDDAYIDENIGALLEADRSLDWLQRMHQYFRDPQVGVVSQSGTWINTRQLGIFWTFPNSHGCKCDVGQGYCFMFSRKVVDTIGVLDPYFSKFWHEESEYALRAKYNGFKVINSGYIGVYHLGSGSGDDGSYGDKLNYLFNKWRPYFNQILEFPNWGDNVKPVRND